MALTATQVETDIITLLEHTNLMAGLNGQLFRGGTRPRDSVKEDAEVFFITGDPGQIEEGVVAINIYVPDIKPFANGVHVKNGARAAQIEQAADQWADELITAKSNYWFRRQQTITTEADPELHQHFVLVKLRYKYFAG